MKDAIRSWDRAKRLGPSLLSLLTLLTVLGFVTWAGPAQASQSKKWVPHYPSFLPKNTLDPHVDAPLVGTEARPALQVEGLPVDVRTKSFHVRIVVSGPVVPGEGLPNQPAATTSTWTVTMKDATAKVPVSLADFHSVDHLGSVFLMGLIPGEHTPPSVLHPGQTLSFKIRSYELVGEGMMQWAPDHEHVVAYWDYTVEND